MVPVTGVALLMQELMTAANLGAIPWAYFAPVLGSIALYSWLALRWAIEQFNREDVLFREAERLDVLLWLKRLFREKEPVPTAGQAFFCLALLIGLRWLTLGMGAGWSPELRTAIGQVAFVAMPALFMVILLNTHPADAMYLRLPRGRETALAALLAFLLLPPITGLAQGVAQWFPEWLQGNHPLIDILQAIDKGSELEPMQFVTYLLSFALVPALCEEHAFRGFVLKGLHQGFRPRNAVLLSSFFFALFHLNAFLFVPTFLLGVVLGLLTVRSRSLFPAIFFHLLYNSVLIGLIPLSRYSDGLLPRLVQDAWPWLIGVCSAAAVALLWWLYRKPYADLAREEAESQLSAAHEQPGK
jgi:sodium transport system permease protein